jgi:hypothetical protein
VLVKACLALAAVIAPPSVVAMALVAALGSGIVAASAGPCKDQIVQLQRFAQSNDPILPQKRDAQLHHQPKLSAVNDAANKAKTEAAAAFARAQEADAKDDAAACAKDVVELKKLYGFAPDDTVTGSVKGVFAVRWRYPMVCRCNAGPALKRRLRLRHSFHRRHIAHAGRRRACR